MEISEKPLQSAEGKAVTPSRSILIAGALVIAILAGAAGYTAGVNTMHPVTRQLSPSPLAQSQSTSSPTPLPANMRSFPVPSTTVNNTDYTPMPWPTYAADINFYDWQRYSSQTLGVSFLYPTNAPGHTRIVDHGDIIGIAQGEGELFHITRYTSIHSWFSTHNGLSETVASPKTSVFNPNTTFHSYPAMFFQDTAQTAQGQNAIAVYSVEVSPTAIYDIVYEIPDPRASIDPQDYGYNENEDNFVSAGMQKVLNSITFTNAPTP